MPSAGTAYVDFVGRFGALQKQLAAVLGPGKLGTMGKVGGAALAAGIGAGVIGKQLYDVGKAFDDATDKIRAGTGATGKSLEGLRNDLKRTYATVPSSLDDTATAITKLNQRLHLTGKPLQDLARQELNLARITKTDLGENIDATTRLFGDWAAQIKNPANAMDRLFRLTQKTGIPLSDLSRLMVQFGSPLRQLGFHFDNAAAMFAKFEAEGVNLQTLMPGFRFALKNLSAPIGEAADMMSKLGISVKDPALALRQIFAEIKGAKTDLEANAIAFAIFGRRAGPDMAAAIREGRFSIDDLLKTMKGGRDTINKAAADTNDFAENWRIFQHQIEVLVEPAASGFFKMVNRGMSRLVQIMGDPNLDFGEKLSKLFSEGGKAMVDAAVKLGPKVAGALIESFLKADVWGQLALTGILVRGFGGKGAFAKLGKAFARQMLMAIASTKIGEAILSYLPTPASMQASGTASGQRYSRGFMIGLGLGFVGLAAVLGNIIAKNVPDISIFSKGYIQRQFSYALQAFKGLGPMLGSVGSSVSKNFRDALTGGLFKNLGEGLRSKLFGALSAMGQGVGGIASSIGGRITGVFASVRDRLSRIFGGMKSAAVNAFNNLKDPVMTVVHKVGAAINWLIGIVAKVIAKFDALKDKLPHIGGGGGGGGIFRGTPLQGPAALLGLQAGGPILVPGQGSGDKVPAMLEPGEVVWNRELVKAVFGSPQKADAPNKIIRRAKGGPIGRGVAAIGGTGLGMSMISAADVIRQARKQGIGGPRLQRMIRFGKQVASRHFPYVYGGGHASFAGPYDCSGFVSAILHAGGLLSSPMTTDGLKTWGQAGPGKTVTVGVRGSTGANAHTMMRVGKFFFESGGSGGGAHVMGGWDGAFPIKRHPKGMQRGGVVGKLREILRGKSTNVFDPRSPDFVGWGMQRGGQVFGSRLGKDQLTTLAAYVGMHNPALMAAIALAESSGIPTRRGGAQEYGLWQILPSTARAFGIPTGNLLDPIKNARGAAKVLRGQGLGAWTTYTSGAYRRFLGGHVKPGLMQVLRGGGALDEGVKPGKTAIPTKLLLRLHHELLRPALDLLATAVHSAKVAVKQAKRTKTAADDIAAFSQLQGALGARSGFLGTLHAWQGNKRSRKALEALVAAEQALFPTPEPTEDLGDLGTDTTTTRPGLTAELLREIGYLRKLGVSFYASQFAGNFAQGGTVPGPPGSTRMALVHGGEQITPPGQLAPPSVRVFIGDRELTDIVRVEVDEHDRVSSNTYRQGVR